MNTVLLKALMDDMAQQAKNQKYYDAFNALETEYRDAVEKAYGLEDADEYLREGWFGRAGDVITSRAKALAGNEDVALGRSKMEAVGPKIVRLVRSQGTRDAFQGAREAEIQIPDPDDPRQVLSYMGTVRAMDKIPYLPNDPRILRRQATQQANKSAFDDMMKKVYGEKQGN